MFACRVRNPGTFCLWNRKPWLLQSEIQLKESRVSVTKTGIRCLESGMRNPESRAWNLKSNTVLNSLIWGDARLGSLPDGVGMRRILCVVFLCGSEDIMGNMRVVLRYYNAKPSHIQKHFHSVLATGLHPLMLLDIIFLTI